jgi:hypothetical protein
MSKKYLVIIGIVSFILGFTINLTAFAAELPVNLGTASNIF